MVEKNGGSIREYRVILDHSIGDEGQKSWTELEMYENLLTNIQ